MPFNKGTVPERLKDKGIPQKYIDRFIEVFRRYNPRNVAAVPTNKTED